MRERSESPRIRRALRALAEITAFSVFAAMAGACASSPTGPREREVLIGGLFSLTGNWSSLGQTGRVAMELAVEDVNQYLAGNAANVVFATAMEDTRLEPALALEKAEALRARGVQLFIGPQSSAEVEHIKPFVDANNLLVLSPSSTAGTLTITGDNIFRFTPADSLESVAASTMMWDDGMRAIVPVWRDDLGNSGLEISTRARFTALGGAVLEGVRYAAGTTDFSATTAAIEAQVRLALDQHGAGKVGVYLAAFDEVASLFTRASAVPVLGSVHWYGSDGVAHSEALLGSPDAAAFAMRVGYPNPIFGVEEGAREIWEPLVARIRARTDIEPDAFALAVYDAVWVVARGYIASGATQDIEMLKRAVTTAASSGYGATGWTVLNDAGDRRYGDYDFWAIREQAGAPQWTRVARYESRTGLLVRLTAAARPVIGTH
jgi:branched-chain amino acid transport system substrate-binding protein